MSPTENGSALRRRGASDAKRCGVTQRFPDDFSIAKFRSACLSNRTFQILRGREIDHDYDVVGSDVVGTFDGTPGESSRPKAASSDRCDLAHRELGTATVDDRRPG